MMEIYAASDRTGMTYRYLGNKTKQAEVPKAEQISSKSKGVKILKSDNRYQIDFENVSYVYRAIKNGSIDIGGETLRLSDEDKQNLKSAAEETSKQMEQNLLQATAEHDAHVAAQQAEALSEEMKHRPNQEDAQTEDKEEWISPLRQIHELTVSMDVAESQVEPLTL